MTMTHAHPEGIYTAACRACRMRQDFAFIESVGVRAPARDVGFLTYVRSFVARHLWSRGQVRAVKLAADAGLSMREFSELVGAARAEVEGGRQ